MTQTFANTLLVVAKDQAQLDEARAFCIEVEDGREPINAQFYNLASGYGLPLEAQRHVAAFISELNPDLCLWWGARPRPILAHHLHQKVIPQLMINAAASDLRPLQSRWRNRAARSALANMDRIYCLDPEAAEIAQHLRLNDQAVELSGTITVTPTPPDADQNRLALLSQAITPRPIWLVANVGADELTLLTRAHREVLKRGIRLVMAVIPSDTFLPSKALEQLRDDRLKAIESIELGALPSQTEVILVNEPDTEGLWYRIAPITFAGGSLSQKTSVLDPMIPAHLGSVVVHGPHFNSHQESFQLLKSQHCTREVTSVSQIVDTLKELMAPDVTASLAHRAWDTVTQGVDATDRLIEAVHTLLDARG